MATTEEVKRDDDVERLFSWLQTPDLRYREFAGAREVTDTVMMLHSPANTPEIEAMSSESFPQEPNRTADPHGFQTEEVIVPPPPLGPPMREAVVRETVTRETVTREAAIREPAMIAPTAMPTSVAETGPFALGAAGRDVSRPPEITQPPQPVALPRVEPPAPQSGPTPTVHAGGDPLGGSSREAGGGGQDAASSSEPQQRQARPLDAVFGRLGNSRPPDPRERLRHIPGLGPPTGRSR
jgi:hypothetical protein